MSVQSQIKEFEREMLSRTRKWSDAAEELGARPGLRAVEFSADLLRAAALSGTMKEWLTQLFEQLPADVAVMDMDWLGGATVHMKCGVSTYSDAYYFIVGSKEWPALAEGSEIPLFQATFKREWVCRNGCGYERNSIDRAACEACGRGRGD